MKTILDRYLDRVLVYANKTSTKSEAIRRELKDHLMQKVDDLVAGGMPREEATLEALRQHGPPRVIGYRLRDPFPWVDVRSHGTARGVIAIGPRAVGIFAFGGVAIGVISCGGCSIGILSAGGFALGLLFTWAGFGLGSVVCGGLAIGLVAAGGFALGAVATGGMAIAAWIPPGWNHDSTFSYYTAANVPHVLRALQPVAQFAMSFCRFAVLILPLYLIAIFVLGWIQHRERKRVDPENDWLFDC